MPEYPKYKLARVAFDMEPGVTLGCYLQEGQNWNGWAVPLMSRSQIECWKDHQRRWNEEVDDNGAIYLTWQGDLLIVRFSEYPDCVYVYPTIIECEGDGSIIVAYDVGLGLTWVKRQ